ncbi:MAG TPA: glycosyltransferase family 39 protein [Candidatus Competibacteraceae bacterium]|nr:glycosyltransferase family 39 protein [Candidatus Competibacteraceae bacterium]HRZ06535.1 glycosyltransferase family 39 protein [Candidatus Competibacteraceae bacterium]
MKRFLLLLILVAIIGGGFLLRFQAVTYTEVDNPIRADAAKYILYAYNLKNFGVYTHSNSGISGNPQLLKPDALVTPGYPLFLALFLDNQRITAYQYYQIQLFQVLLSTATILLSYLLCIPLLNRNLSLVVATLVALSPHLINMNVYLLTETLFCFFLTAFLAVMAWIKSPTDYGRLFGAGVLFGLATLTRPYTQGFVIVSALLLLAPSFRLGLWRVLALLLGFSVIVAPWVIRNLVVLDQVSDPTLTITSLYHGFYPGMMYEFRPESLGFPYRFDPKVNEFVYTLPGFVNELSQRAARQPWVYFEWYLWGKTATVFSWSILAGMGDVFVYPVIKTPYVDLSYFKSTHEFMRFTHEPLMILSLVGVILAWLPAKIAPVSHKAQWVGRFLALFILYFMILHILGAPFPRYSIPIRPVTYSMALFSLLVCWLILKQHSVSHSASSMENKS